MRGDANSAARVYRLVCRLDTLRDITLAARSTRPTCDHAASRERLAPPDGRTCRQAVYFGSSPQLQRCHSCVGWLIRSQARPGTAWRRAPGWHDDACKPLDLTDAELAATATACHTMAFQESERAKGMQNLGMRAPIENAAKRYCAARREVRGGAP